VKDSTSVSGGDGDQWLHWQPVWIDSMVTLIIPTSWCSCPVCPPPLGIGKV
jgi:hypothetical protein